MHSRLFNLSVLVTYLALSLQASAAPTAGDPSKAFPLTKSELGELGRLAKVINSAHCPSHRHLQPGGALTPSPRSLRRKESTEEEQADAAATAIAEQGRRRVVSANGLERGSNILGSSHDARMAASMAKGEAAAHQAEAVNWYIAHSPESGKLTLSVSSLHDTDAFLKLLSQAPVASVSPAKMSYPPSPDVQKLLRVSKKASLLVPLPEILFPERLMLQYFPKGAERPRIHHALLEPLLRDGPSLVLSLMDTLQNPPMENVPLSDGTVTQVPSAIDKLEVVGHGLGSNVGLLVAMSVHMHMNDPVKAATATAPRRRPRPAKASSPPANYDAGTVFAKVLDQVSGRKWWSPARRSEKTPTGPRPLEITAKLFSMNRVGDLVFAQWVDSLVGASSSAAPSTPSTFSVTRVTSYADPIPHLPATWQGFAHFRSGEVWFDSDPKLAWSCPATIDETGVHAGTPKEARYEAGSCTNRVAMDKTSLLDHAGPFGGVWVGGEACR